LLLKSEDGLVTLFRIKWGRRTYLIGEPEFKPFCESINFGWEPAKDWSGFYLLKGDINKSTSGKPDLPEKWKPYLLE
jgi:hypothetical protein